MPGVFDLDGTGVCAGTFSPVVGPGVVTAEGWLLLSAVRVRSGPAELNITIAATKTTAAMPIGIPQLMFL